MARSNKGSSQNGNAKHKHREPWLAEALELLCAYLLTLGLKLPVKIRMAISPPASGRGNSLPGEIFRDTRSAGGFYELFIKGGIDDELDVLTVLVSLLVAVLIPEGGNHRRQYNALAAKVGLVGSKAAPTPNSALRKQLTEIIEKLGPLAHDKIQGSLRPVNAAKPQTSRSITFKCPTCGYPSTTTRFWSDQSVPRCPIHNVEMDLQKCRRARSMTSAEPGGTAAHESACGTQPQGPESAPERQSEHDRESPPETYSLAALDPPSTETGKIAADHPIPGATASIVAPEHPPGLKDDDLLSGIQVHGPQRFTVSFPVAPPPDVTERVKQHGGKYQSGRKCWEGILRGSVDSLRTTVIESGGILKLFPEVGSMD